MNKIKEKILFEIKSVKKDVTVVEYIFWWIVRICLIWGFVGALKGGDQQRIITVGANILGSFAFTLMRLISPEKSFLCRTSYRVQSIIEFTCFSGCYLLHCTNFYDNIEKYDFWLHMISGATITIVGFYLAKALDKNNTANPSMLTLGATGFSFTAIVAWEMMEFITDALILDSTNQNYRWNITAEGNPTWYGLLSRSKNFEGQMPIMDTMVDMILAAVAAAVTSIILFAIIRHSSKKNSKTK